MYAVELISMGSHSAFYGACIVMGNSSMILTIATTVSGLNIVSGRSSGFDFIV